MVISAASYHDITMAARGDFPDLQRIEMLGLCRDIIIALSPGENLFKKLLSTCPKLEEIIFHGSWGSASYSGLGDRGLRYLSEALQEVESSRLRTLDLTYQGIGMLGACSLAAALKSPACSSLQTLLLGGNEIGIPGIHALTTAIKMGALPKLQELDISFATGLWAGISSPRHLEDMAKALCSYGHQNLRKLGLSGLPWDESAMDAWLGLIVANRGLTHLSLGSSLPFEDMGERFAHGLRKEGLEYLGVEELKLDSELGRSMIDVLQVFPNLRKLSMEDLGDLGDIEKLIDVSWKGACTRLTKLSLEGRAGSGKMHADSIHRLGRALEGGLWPSLKVLRTSKWDSTFKKTDIPYQRLVKIAFPQKR